MKKILLYLPGILFVFLATQLSAQTKASVISGVVYSPDSNPAEYSTVVLMNQDSVFITGTLTGPDGKYSFEKLGQGIYHIMVRNVEFNTWISRPIEVTGSDLIELERVDLTTKVTGLEEVVIKGEKAIVEVRPDKMVVNVSASTNATGNNALELLSKSPGVILDMDNNIILQGKSGVQIYINGRPSRISGTDLTNMLEGMRSEDIESIEIITNPSSRYDAEGTGGIINIVLKKNLNQGFNGSVRSSYSRGFYPRAGLGTSLNYAKGKVNMFSSISLSDDNYNTRIDEDMQREDFLLLENSYQFTDRKGINFSGGLDYRIHPEHLVSIDARVLVNDRIGSAESTTFILDNDGILDTEQLVAGTSSDGFSQNYNTNLHYEFNPNRSTKFSSDVSYGYFVNDRNTLQPNNYFDEDGITLLRTIEDEFDESTNINLFSAQADFERKLSKMTFSTGVKYSYISTDNGLTFYNLDTGSPVLNPDRSNDFNYLEEIAAGYVILNGSITERIRLNAGLRVENTSSLGELISSNPGPDDVVPRNYISLFPNVSLSYNDNVKHALSLSVGRRITRPNYRNLNPFESKTSELSAWKGNPFLQPNFIENYQLTYSFKRKLVISNTFSITRNFFANVFVSVSDKGNILTPRNLENAYNNGLSISYPLKVTKWWQFASFFNYNYSIYQGNVSGTIIDLQANIFNFRMQNNLKLPLGFQGELTAYITSPWIWRGTVNVDGNYSINAGLKRSFLNDNLLLQVSVNDIFNTGTTYFYSSNYGGMLVDGNINFDGRRIAFSATYNFGNQKLKTRRSKSAMDAELRRISD